MSAVSNVPVSSDLARRVVHSDDLSRTSYQASKCVVSEEPDALHCRAPSLLHDPRLDP
jgi:hypothetical protein